MSDPKKAGGTPICFCIEGRGINLACRVHGATPASSPIASLVERLREHDEHSWAELSEVAAALLRSEQERDAAIGHLLDIAENMAHTGHTLAGYTAPRGAPPSWCGPCRAEDALHADPTFTHKACAFPAPPAPS